MDWRTRLTVSALLVAPAFAVLAQTPLGMDPFSSPGDGFFRYANGHWLDVTPMSADHAEVGAMQSAIDGMDAKLRSILDGTATAPPDTNAGKVGIYYRAFGDASARKASGLTPVASLLRAIAEAPDRSALAVLMGREQVDFVGSLVDAHVDVDHADGHRYAVFLEPGVQGLPAAEDYFAPGFAPQREAYRDYLRFLLKKASWPDAPKAADEVLSFESMLAHDSTREEDDIAHPVDRAAWVRGVSPFDANVFLRALDVPADARLAVSRPHALHAMAERYAHASMATLRAWMTARAMDRAAPYLTADLVSAWQRFHEQALTGRAVPLPAWQLAVRGATGTQCVGGGGPDADCFGSLRWAAGDLYLARYFPDDVRRQAMVMIEALRSAFRERLAHEPWMSTSTRIAALRKLDAYTVKLGGPSQTADLSGLSLREGDLVGDTRAIAAGDWQAQLERLRERVDPTAWVEAPQTVDANNGEALDVEFPAGLFQPPVFDVSRDAAYNFGALGAFIGHEWTHGFDDEGRHIDADNRRRDWWSTDDDRAFRHRANALIQQYDAFEPLPGVHVDGRRTLGENIADLGGLSVALDAYHAFLHGRPAPVVDGLTGDQRVFLGWAWLWRGRKSGEALRQQLADDVHSPYAVRVDAVVRNIDAWYSAFHVEGGQQLYVAPTERVRLW
ncbi:M13 family metallopeptidase [Luteibacter aegosomatis]|uniref:M13-type metalloendopeptidase n=1 Tax=Luteibacter aegosomatis TaxID=2911537 RepID=UPI001FF8ED48|nr:M13 family metallopeptidase [Luteibacter aegosomatis]UPG85341.1 M13 family metallopeptidase [Luteibacter aegosomatis]